MTTLPILEGKVLLNTTDTYSEIKQQPEMWQLTEEIIKDIKSDFDKFIKDIEKNATGKLKVLFTGAGSSAYVGDILRTAIDTKHMPKWDFESVPTTHFVTSPEAYIDSETTYLIVSFARSGNSPETKATIDLVEQLSDNVHHLFITNNKSGYLATEESLKHVFKVILPKQTNDKSLAMTSSFSSMLVAGYLLFNGSITNGFYDTADSLFEYLKELADQTLQKSFEKVFYVGTGLLGELTKEVSLKLNELTGGHVEIARETTLGFRHGPKAGLKKGSIFILLRSNETYKRDYESDLLNEVNKVKDKYQLLILDGQSSDESTQIPNIEDYNDFEIGLIYLMFGQLLASKKSVELGLNPDNPSPDGFINRVVKGVTIYSYS